MSKKKQEQQQHLLDEEALEKQEPLKDPKGSKGSKNRRPLPPLRHGGTSSDDSYSSYDDDGYDSADSEGSWASCDSNEWDRPQPHDTVRVRGTTNVFGVVEETDYHQTNWCDEHAELNDIRIDEMGDSVSSTDEDEEFVTVYMSMPLPYSQISQDQYLATVALDSPHPTAIRNDTLVGDDMALRRVRQFSEKKLEIVDRAVNCGVVHTTAEGESGITINSRIEALVSPLCFTNGGDPPADQLSFPSMTYNKPPAAGKHRKKSKAGSNSDSSSLQHPVKLRDFVDHDYSSNKMKQQHKNEFVDVDVRGLQYAMKEAKDSHNKHRVQGDSDNEDHREPAAFCEWVKIADAFIGAQVKPFNIIGEQFFVVNPFRTGTVVLYDGPRCEDPALDVGNDVDSVYLEDESNFGFVKSCASHVLLQLYPQVSNTAVISDSPHPTAKTPARDPPDQKLNLDGHYLPDHSGPIIVALDGDDIIDTNFDVLSVDRAKCGKLGNPRDESDPARLKVFPSYVDPISPGHVIENVSLEFIEKSSTFVYGSFDDISLQSTGKEPAATASKKNAKINKKRPPKKYEGVRLTAVVVMVYPSRVQVINEVTGLEREFSPWELLVLESFRADNCMVGRTGFVLDVQKPFAGKTLHDGSVELQVETRMGRGDGHAPEKRVGKKEKKDEDEETTSKDTPSSVEISHSDDDDGTNPYNSSESDDEPSTQPVPRIPKLKRERRTVKETSMATLHEIMEQRRALQRYLPHKEKAETQREAFVTKHCSTTTWVPRFGTNYVVGACKPSADASRQFYQDIGLVFNMEEDFAYRKLENIHTTKAVAKKKAFWQKKVQQVMPYMHRLVSINATSSTLDLILRDGKIIYNMPATKILESSRKEDVDHDFYPMDLVVPSTMRFSSMPISWKALEPVGGEDACDGHGRPLKYENVGDELVHTRVDKASSGEDHDGPTVQGFVDAGCSVYDAQLLYDYEMELQTSEIVYVRRRNDAFFVENDLKTINGDPGVGTKSYEKDSPSVIGIVLSCDNEDQVCDVRWVKQEPDLDCARTRYGHMCGEVVELLPNTKVRVMWQDGTLADMWRGELSSVTDLEEDDEDHDQFTADGQSMSYSTEEEAEETGPPPAETPPLDSSISPRSLLNKLNGGLTALAQKLGVSPSVSEQDKKEDAAERHLSVQTESDKEEEEASVVAPGECGTFTVCSMFSAHRFRDNEDEKGTAGVNAASRAKRIQKEWKNLRENLPPGVTVKVCEDDLNIMKFSLLGPIHTPYYQSLLCFDLFFPPDFPMVPPKVHFHSFGLKLNPNLYENGHICLSLLGTWTGESTSEGWMPATSTVLQIIISIQGLVLVKEPFYNEAGFDEKRGTVQGRELSKAFSESIQQKRLQHMILSARSPVPDWGYETRQHFTRYAPHVMSRLQKLVDLAAAATATSGATITADGLVLPISKGACKAMQPLLKALGTTHATLTAQWEEDEAKEKAYFAHQGDNTPPPDAKSK